MGKEAFNRLAGRSHSSADEVIYQIYPRTFKDSNNDGHGDIQGITQQLDYIASLGVDAIWISPMYLAPEGPEGDGGYAVQCHRTIDPKYGTLDDFRHLVKQAEKRNLKIYMDFVLPHTAHTHEWFLKSRDPSHADHAQYKDFYVWHPGHYMINGKCMDADAAKEKALRGEIFLPQERPGMPNNWKSVFGGPSWTWDEIRGAYYLHHFFPSQPSVNLNRTNVQDAVFEEMKFWEELGVKGFRLDSVPYSNYDPEFRDDDWMRGTYPFQDQNWMDQYLSHSMCQDSTNELIRRMRAEFPDIKLMGEVIAGKKGGSEAMELAEAYIASGLDACYTTSERAVGQAGPDYIRGMLAHFEGKFPDSGLMFTISDHDGFNENPRAYTRITRHVGQEYKETAYRQAMQLYAALRGTLSVFQGDELGLPHARIPEDIPYSLLKDDIARTKGVQYCRDGSRAPFASHSGRKNAGFSDSDAPYLPVPGSYYPRAVNVQEPDSDSTLNFTRDLLAWRKQQSALKTGKTVVLKTEGNLLAFLRQNDEQTILCTFNLGGEKFYFRPADILDARTLRNVGLNTNDLFVMHPYGYEFAGETGPDCSKRRCYIPLYERPEERQPHAEPAVGSLALA